MDEGGNEKEGESVGEVLCVMRGVGNVVVDDVRGGSGDENDVKGEGGEEDGAAKGDGRKGTVDGVVE